MVHFNPLEAFDTAPRCTLQAPLLMGHPDGLFALLGVIPPTAVDGLLELYAHEAKPSAGDVDFSATWINTDGLLSLVALLTGSQSSVRLRIDLDSDTAVAAHPLRPGMTAIYPSKDALMVAVNSLQGGEPAGVWQQLGIWIGVALDV